MGQSCITDVSDAGFGLGWWEWYLTKMLMIKNLKRRDLDKTVVGSISEQPTQHSTLSH